MPNKDLTIKNMVCARCIKVVNDALAELQPKSGFELRSVQLGKVLFSQPLSPEQLASITAELEALGFEIITDKRRELVEAIKTLIIKSVRNTTEKHGTLSEYLEKGTGYDYPYISSLFSSIEGVTIEKYAIAQRIEYVKELIVYNEMSLSEIAFSVGYSSVHHLSNQFKKVTGMTPTRFKSLGIASRKFLDEV